MLSTTQTFYDNSSWDWVQEVITTKIQKGLLKPDQLKPVGQAMLLLLCLWKTNCLFTVFIYVYCFNTIIQIDWVLSILQNKILSEVGFEPTPPEETATWTQRLRPLGHPDVKQAVKAVRNLFQEGEGLGALECTACVPR